MRAAALRVVGKWRERAGDCKTWKKGRRIRFRERVTGQLGSNREMRRVIVVAIAAALLTGCRASEAHGRQAIVLGVDGMDPGFLERHWSELPNLARLRDRGGFRRLATTMPPQSPVAWSTFITGLDPAENGVFDFVERDPGTMQPYSWMGRTF
jgi:hypothetical protein